MTRAAMQRARASPSELLARSCACNSASACWELTLHFEQPRQTWPCRQHTCAIPSAGQQTSRVTRSTVSPPTLHTIFPAGVRCSNPLVLRRPAGPAALGGPLQQQRCVPPARPPGLRKLRRERLSPRRRACCASPLCRELRRRRLGVNCVRRWARRGATAGELHVVVSLWVPRPGACMCLGACSAVLLGISAVYWNYWCTHRHGSSAGAVQPGCLSKLICCPLHHRGQGPTQPCCAACHTRFPLMPSLCLIPHGPSVNTECLFQPAAHHKSRASTLWRSSNHYCQTTCSPCLPVLPRLPSTP